MKKLLQSITAFLLISGMCSETILFARDQVGKNPDAKHYADSSPFLTLEKVDGSNISPLFCYYRLNIDPDMPVAKSHIKHVKRSAIDRFFDGVDYSFNSLLKVKVALYEDSIILFSRSYRSSLKEGENHDRSSLIRGTDYPVFLLQRDSNGEARITASADMKRTQSFNIAGSALEAVSAALKAVAPTADIITKLTSDSTKAVAQKIDAGAGAFLGATGKNEETLDINIVRGDKFTVSIFGPNYEVNSNKTDFMLGKWIVGFESPFASYFHQDVKCGPEAEQEAWNKHGTSRSLLSTQLVGNVGEIGTMGSYLKQLDWWSGARVLVTGKLANSPEVEDFCRAVVMAVSDLGFNTVDAYLVADAVARSNLVGQAAGAAMLGSDSCDFLDRNKP